MNLVGLLAIILATWRVSHLLVHEAGPFDMFVKWRELFGIQHDEDGEIRVIPEKVLPKLLSCIPCMSIWIAGIVCLTWYLWTVPVWILAASGGASIINKVRE